MTRFLGAWGFGLPIWLLIPGAVAAQARIRPSHTDSVASALARLNAGSSIRIARLGSPATSGKLSGLTRDTLRLGASGTIRPFRLDEITGVWSRGRHWKLGGLVGSIVGLAGGLFLGAVANGLCEGSCNDDAEVYVATSALGLVGGGALGVVIGAAIPKWDQRFP